MIHIVLCDDDQRASATIVKLLNGWYLPQQIKVEYYTSGQSLLTAMEQDVRVDIALLDIELGAENGLKLAEAMWQQSPETSFVFITAHSRYSQEIFTGNVDPSGFLTKPVQPELLKMVLDKLINRIYQQGHTLVLDCRGGSVVVDTRGILYVESKGHNLTVHLEDREYMLRSTLDAFQEKLPRYFARTHKSYLVNCNRVRAFSAVDVCMENDKHVPVSRAMRTSARHHFLRIKGMEL